MRRRINLFTRKSNIFCHGGFDLNLGQHPLLSELFLMLVAGQLRGQITVGEDVSMIWYAKGPKTPWT